jgi:tRNA (adenine22-N1)-methyltransferase
MPTPRLSARLQQLAEWVLPGRPVADVGCDHALLPIWLVQQGRVPFALAMDVSEDAIASARTLVERTPGLGGRVQVRRSDGLSAIAPGDVSTLVVSGLGGKTISGILEAAAPDVLEPLSRGIFQPNIGAPTLRATLNALGWAIADEEVVLCGGIRYPIIAAAPAASGASAGSGGGDDGASVQPLEDADMLFGPVLRRRRPPEWLAMLRDEEQHYTRIAANIARAAERRARKRRAEHAPPSEALEARHARKAEDVAERLAQMREELAGGACV